MDVKKDNAPARSEAALSGTIQMDIGMDGEVRRLGCRPVEFLPDVGEMFDGHAVLEVRQLQKAQEQPSAAAMDADCFLVVTDGAEPVYAAISHSRRNHFQLAVNILGYPPTFREADIVLTELLKDSERTKGIRIAEELRSFLNRGGESIIRDYFGISPEKYERAVAGSPLIPEYCDPLSEMCGNDLPAVCGRSAITVCPDPCIYVYVPYWWDESADFLEVERSDFREFRDRGLFPARTEKDLYPSVFNLIVRACDEFGKDWVAYEGYPQYFDLISLCPNEILDITGKITGICCGPFKDILKAAGLTQREFAKRFYISTRTVEEWCSGKNSCKIYIRLMFAELLGLIKRRYPETSGKKDRR